MTMLSISPGNYMMDFMLHAPWLLIALFISSWIIYSIKRDASFLKKCMLLFLITAFIYSTALDQAVMLHLEDIRRTTGNFDPTQEAEYSSGHKTWSLVLKCISAAGFTLMMISTIAFKSASIIGEKPSDPDQIGE